MSITSVNLTYSSSSLISALTPSQRTTVLIGSNRAYLRQMFLSDQGLTMVRGTSSVFFPLSELQKIANTADPSLTYAPRIDIQPTSALSQSTSNSVSFSLSASAETSITYQWYQLSASAANYQILTGSYTSSFGNHITGSQTQALTCSAPIHTLSGSLFFCLCSNNSGQTSSSIASLTVYN